MISILRYSFNDLIRSRWSLIYLLFYVIIGLALLFLNSNLSKAIITLMNVIVVLIPMISTIFGVTYYYNSREFTELLLSQPIPRTTVFMGQYLGLAGSLSLSLLLGLGIPFLLYGVFQSAEISNFLLLLVTGTFLTFIFTAFAMNISMAHENRVKGFGYAILFWLLLAVIYDGLFMILLILFSEYPLDQFALLATFINPIDLSRILILLKLDISALLGYTGAVFNRFFGTPLGMWLAMGMLTFWTLAPIGLLIRQAKKKDF